MQLLSMVILAIGSIAVSANNAGLNASTVYITEIHTAFTTVCPTPVEFVYKDKTYIANKSMTLTVTNCPCTVIKPIIKTSSVYCWDCHTASSSIPLYGNSSQTKPVGTGTVASISTTISADRAPTHVTSSASKVFTISSAWILGIISLLPLMKT